MAILTDNIKLVIVQALACFDTPSQVAEAVKQEFGVEVSRMQVALYDPTKGTGKNLSAKLRAIFAETRDKFLADVSTIPIAQQAYRLRVLQRTLAKAEKQGNSSMVSQLLEQAAKESGGAFTNRRELTGKGGAPLAVSNVSPEALQAAVTSVRDKF
ncbi:MAG: DUF2280 domain-containing protein [Burkholderiales bacterium]|nr:MAG: DUF2280 domain-containing protein [Burkholderiales bacterium]